MITGESKSKKPKSSESFKCFLGPMINNSFLIYGPVEAFINKIYIGIRTTIIL